MPNFRNLFASVLFCALASAASAQWIKQNVNTTASFRGLSVVNEKIVWASGTAGTVIRTIDGGKTWNVITVPGAEQLDFRDIEAFDADTAYILSIGNGESSRIYKTVDGGKTWQVEFTNEDPKAFYDAMACFDRKTCFAMSDPVDGRFVLIKRMPGVHSRIGIRIPKWLPIDNSALTAKQGEAAFAASGTCLIAQGKSNLFLVTGGSAARVFRSNDQGMTWSVAETPIVHGTSGSGIFSIAMKDSVHGVIVGGNYQKASEISDNLAFTVDGGRSWQLKSGLGGYRSGVAYVDSLTLIAVGTSGTDVSLDSGKNWKQISDKNFNATKALSRGFTWAAGPNGVIARQQDRVGQNISRSRVSHSRQFSEQLLGNVTNLVLSPSIVSMTCDKSDDECANSKLIHVATTAIDVGEMKYVYTVTGGRIVGDGPTVQWDLTDLKPGIYTITAGISQPSKIFGWRVFGKTMTESVTVKP
jgi:photosystem II stability/assembly factor-like uncharacterized protein